MKQKAPREGSVTECAIKYNRTKAKLTTIVDAPYKSTVTNA